MRTYRTQPPQSLLPFLRRIFARFLAPPAPFWPLTSLKLLRSMTRGERIFQCLPLKGKNVNESVGTAIVIDERVIVVKVALINQISEYPFMNNYSTATKH